MKNESSEKGTPTLLLSIVGYGGSIGFAAPTKNFSFAYVMNRLDYTATGLDHRYRSILKRISEYLNR